MKLCVEIPGEAQEGGGTESNEDSEQECVSMRRRADVVEGCVQTEGRDDAGGGDGGVQEDAAGEGEGGVVMEPPDGGWGWVVAFASALVMTLVNALVPCFGVLFSTYFLIEGVSSTIAAWIFNIEALVFNIAALFVGPLSLEFGWRKTGIAGSLLASVAFTITAFTPSPEFLFFSFSVLCGAGCGIVSTLCYIVVPCYFKKRRGVSNAIMTCGTSIGQTAIPPLITFLQVNYGDRGAILIYSSLMLHSCIAVTTFHPVEWHMKPSTARSTEEGSRDTKLQSKAERPSSSSSPKPSIFLRVAKSVISDLTILRQWRACIIALSWSLVITSTLNFLMIVPFALQDAGFTLDFSAWCLTSLGFASMVSRTVTSAVTDLPFFSPSIFFVVGCVLMGVSMAVFPLVSSEGLLMTVMVFAGLGLGNIAGLFSLMIIEVMGIKLLAPTIGTSSLVNGLFLVTLGPLVGFVRDVSASYPVSVWVMSGMMGLAVLLWALMGQAKRWDAERGKGGLGIL